MQDVYPVPLQRTDIFTSRSRRGMAVPPDLALDPDLAAHPRHRIRFCAFLCKMEINGDSTVSQPNFFRKQVIFKFFFHISYCSFRQFLRELQPDS